ncbi:hypothetical protein GIB67_028204 [Kingdonia uniflora]|uniref:glutathione transferase n=1 Tax=Kingdonia uniflora TaxID=39325 RepID=A0A7J7KZ49_9MAGN|nr:hypothetical protein GIB67_028204 [Kingdonia uniflora]
MMKLKQDPTVIKQSEDKLAKVLDVYEQRLEESRYLAGEEFTLADLSHLPNTQYLVNRTDRGDQITSRKNVGRWWDEISGRDSLKKVVELQRLVYFKSSRAVTPLVPFSPRDSILTFDQLQKIFVKTYAHHKDKEENLYTLISLKQAQEKKLKVFSKKFLELARKVDNLDKKITVSAFTNTLQLDCKAKEHLFLNKPSTLEDTMEKVYGYIDLERMMSERHKFTKNVLTAKGPLTDRNRKRSNDAQGDKKRTKKVIRKL